MLTIIGNDIKYAAKLLKSGEIVGIPTETVYGLAANVYNESALIKIFKTKKRPHFDPLIVHIANIESFNTVALSIPDIAYRLAEKFSPGPLTFILKKRSAIPDLVTAGKETVAVRVPSHPSTLELIRCTGFPIAAPSANLFGYVSPVSANDVYDQFNDKIPFILDGGSCNVGIESTIISFENNKIIVLRPGGISIEEIKKVHNNVLLEKNYKEMPDAPGMLKSHYATNKPLYAGTINELKQIKSETKLNAGWILYNQNLNSEPDEHQIILSPDDSLETAAKNLFRSMRQLDKNKKIQIILAERVPEKGLGIAINDRLKRAAINK